MAKYICSFPKLRDFYTTPRRRGDGRIFDGKVPCPAEVLETIHVTIITAAKEARMSAAPSLALVASFPRHPTAAMWSGRPERSLEVPSTLLFLKHWKPIGQSRQPAHPLTCGTTSVSPRRAETSTRQIGNVRQPASPVIKQSKEQPCQPGVPANRFGPSSRSAQDGVGRHTRIRILGRSASYPQHNTSPSPSIITKGGRSGDRRLPRHPVTMETASLVRSPSHALAQLLTTQ